MKQSQTKEDRYPWVIRPRRQVVVDRRCTVCDHVYVQVMDQDHVEAKEAENREVGTSPCNVCGEPGRDTGKTHWP